MIGKLYEIEQQVEKLEKVINKLTIFTNALAQCMIDKDVCGPDEIIKAISEKMKEAPNAK